MKNKHLHKIPILAMVTCFFLTGSTCSASISFFGPSVYTDNDPTRGIPHIGYFTYARGVNGELLADSIDFNSVSMFRNTASGETVRAVQFPGFYGSEFVKGFTENFMRSLIAFNEEAKKAGRPLLLIVYTWRPWLSTLKERPLYFVSANEDNIFKIGGGWERA